MTKMVIAFVTLMTLAGASAFADGHGTTYDPNSNTSTLPCGLKASGDLRSSKGSLTAKNFDPVTREARPATARASGQVTQ